MYLLELRLKENFHSHNLAGEHISESVWALQAFQCGFCGFFETGSLAHRIFLAFSVGYSSKRTVSCCRMTDTGGSSFATKCVFHRPSFSCEFRDYVRQAAWLSDPCFFDSPWGCPSPSACGERMIRAGTSASWVEYRVRARINKGGLGSTFANCGYRSAISR